MGDRDPEIENAIEIGSHTQSIERFFSPNSNVMLGEANQGFIKFVIYIQSGTRMQFLLSNIIVHLNNTDVREPWRYDTKQRKVLASILDLDKG